MSKNTPTYHHRIPKTYMKPWCFSNDTIWTYEKATGKSEIRNIENICGINHFHSMKAGSLHINEVALQKIFGFLSDYSVIFDGVELKTLEEMNRHFLDFEKWEIYYPKGDRVNKRDRNTIYQRLSQAADTSIEDKWNREFENDWNAISSQVYDTLNQSNENVVLTTNAAEVIMKYFIMIEWRGKYGNSALGSLWDFVFGEVFTGGEDVIPAKDRIYHSDKTIEQEMRHSFLLRTFDEFFNEKGAMYEVYKIYCEQLTFVFLFSKEKKFITSDNPCFTFVNKDQLKEPVFVALPHLLISLAKKDPDAPNSYRIATLTDEQVDEYNTATYQNGDLILSSEKIL